MTQPKTMTPYAKLKQDIKEFVNRLRLPQVVTMWCYPKNKLNSGWDLTDLYNRTHAANACGWDVILKATDDGIVVSYRQRMTIPAHFSCLR